MDQPAQVPAMLLKHGQLVKRFDCSRPDVAQPSPLVSCLMVTARRPHRAKLAVECFRNQTYPNLELVIVDDGPTDELADFVHDMKDDRLRMVRMSHAGDKLGRLRNVSLQQARGEFVCQ